MEMFQGNLAQLYPEIECANGLSNALDDAFARINAPFKTSVDENGNLPITYAIVVHQNKLSQIYIAAEKRLYLSDYWRDGVCLANGGIKSITVLAQTIDHWFRNDISAKQLARSYPGITPTKRASAFDEGREVANALNFLAQDKTMVELHDFVKLALQDEVISKFFPFTSLYTLRLSRCTGFPFDTEDLPYVTAKKHANFSIPGYRCSDDKLFVVAKNKTEIIGEGTAEDALRMVRENLPADIKPEVKGAVDGNA